LSPAFDEVHYVLKINCCAFLYIDLFNKYFTKKSRLFLRISPTLLS
jgi:hypothetical protein